MVCFGLALFCFGFALVWLVVSLLPRWCLLVFGEASNLPSQDSLFLSQKIRCWQLSTNHPRWLMNPLKKKNLKTTENHGKPANFPGKIYGFSFFFLLPLVFYETHGSARRSGSSDRFLSGLVSARKGTMCRFFTKWAGDPRALAKLEGFSIGK